LPQSGVNQWNDHQNSISQEVVEFRLTKFNLSRINQRLFKWIFSKWGRLLYNCCALVLEKPEGLVYL